MFIRKFLMPWLFMLCLGGFVGYQLGYQSGHDQGFDKVSGAFKELTDSTLAYTEAVRLEGLITEHKVVRSKNLAVIEAMATDKILHTINTIDGKNYHNSPFKEQIDLAIIEARKYLSTLPEESFPEELLKPSEN